MPNLEALRNPGGVAPTALPLTLRMLSHVPILVSSRRSQTSGSPTHVTAKLWLHPVPAAAAHALPAAAAAEAGGAAGGAGGAQAPAGALREAVSHALHEGYD